MVCTSFFVSKWLSEQNYRNWSIALFKICQFVEYIVAVSIHFSYRLKLEFRALCMCIHQYLPFQLKWNKYWNSWHYHTAGGEKQFEKTIFFHRMREFQSSCLHCVSHIYKSTIRWWSWLYNLIHKWIGYGFVVKNE